MAVTLDDYRDALQAMLDDVAGMGGDVLSVHLTGSMARGGVAPGRSDIMDAILFLRPHVFDAEARFKRALESMVSSCERLSARGLPFHPFIYMSEDELGSTPAMFLPTNRAEGSSKIVYGEDVRPRLGARPASYFVARTSFFDLRQKCLQLVIYLHEEPLAGPERGRVLYVLRAIAKALPVVACLACDVWPTLTDAAAALEAALPGAGTGVLPKLELIRGHRDDAFDSEELKALVGDLLDFLEALHSRLLARYEAGIEWQDLASGPP